TVSLPRLRLHLPSSIFSCLACWFSSRRVGIIAAVDSRSSRAAPLSGTSFRIHLFAADSIAAEDAGRQLISPYLRDFIARIRRIISLGHRPGQCSAWRGSPISRPGLLAQAPAMANKILLVALAAHVVFFATGGLVLGFSVVARSRMDNAPKDGQDAVRHLLFKNFPFTAGIVNAAFILAAFVFTLPGLISPVRGWLKVGGYMITFCGLFTLCVGVHLWVMTLRVQESFFPTFLAQDPAVHQMIQKSFGCCGYFNHTTPAFVTDATCPSPAAAALTRGCATAISGFSNVFIDRLFTAVFGMVGVDTVLILAIACLLKDRKERERYRDIDEKTGYRQI
ncbi:Uncharacterized protein TPAR_07236, partial [Tolypocladium paradoxum]